MPKQKMTSPKLSWFSLLLICLPLGAFSQQSAPLKISEIGTPFINTYAIADHFTSRATYNTKEAENGVMYFANGWGLGFFDGATWQLIGSGRRTEVYDLAFGKENRIYTTHRNDLGFWAPNEQGVFVRTSLTDQLPEGVSTDAVFRQVVSLDSLVVFRSATSLLTYDEATESFTLIKSVGEFREAVVVDGKLLVSDTEQGLLELVGNKLSPLASIPSNTGVITHLGNKGKSGSPIVITSKGLLFQLTPDGFQRWDTGIDDYLQGLEISSLIGIADDYVLIATRKGGVFILDAKGELVQKFSTELGLLDSEVQSAMIDQRGDLWIGHYAGISHIILSEPLSTLDRRHGLPGEFANTIVEHKDRIYVGTNTGLAYKPLDEPWLKTTENKSFTTQPSFDARVDLLFSTGEDLFAASRKGFYQVKGNEMKLLFSDEIIGEGTVAPGNKHLLLMSLAGNVRLLSKEGDQWRDKGRIKGLPEGSAIVNAAENGIWLLDGRDKFFKIELNSAFDSLVSIKEYGEQEGVPQGVDLRLFPNPIGLVLATGSGAFLYDKVSDSFKSAEPFDQYLGEEYLHRFHELPNGKILTNGFLHGSIGKALFTPTDEGYRYEEYPINRVGLIAAQQYVGFDNQFWIAGRGITVFRPDDVNLNAPDFSTLIRGASIITKGDSLVYGGAGKSATMRFGSAENALKFTFAAASFDEPDKLQFQSYLEGSETTWAPWTTENTRTYTNLPHGSYTFKVRARNVYGQIGHEDAYSFTIITPWYLTGWAYILYAILVVVVIRLIVKLNLRRVENEKKALEQTVLERTEEIRFQKDEIEEQANRLRELDKVKSRFFANISHELRTPLTLINAPLESLIHNGKVNDPEVRETLETATRNGVSLLSLVEEILDLAKLDGGKLKLIENPVRVNDFMTLTLGDYKSGFRHKSIQLVYKFYPKPGLAILMDEGRCAKIINNLLSNALKFTPEGGTISVVVDEDIEDDLLFIKVQDTGIGIHPSDIPHIFDRYYQSEQPGKKAEGGTGIGLALAKELAELHGGKLTVTSELEVGTSFVFELPIREVLEETVVPMSQIEDVELGKALNATIERYVEKFEVDKPVLLITEDHPEMRAFIAKTLSPYFSIRQAENGKVALGILNSERIDIVISDVMMPVMDGFELLEAIKKDKTLHQVSLIMLTARADHEDKLYALTLGIDDYLTKPFSASEFLARIKNILENRIKIIRELDKGGSTEDLTALAKQYDLVEREIEVLNLLAQRYTNPQIAETLFISRNTVKFHIKNLFGKMGIKTRKEAAERVSV